MIYDGVGEPPSGYGYIFDASTATDANGNATATWRGTSPGTVQLEVQDEDVLLTGTGEKPKGKTGDIKTKGDPTGKSGVADIYNGQNGAKVAEDKEASVGAFTVANLNDTDGDGGQPDKIVPDKDDKSVKATKLGRDEVDLMALVIHPQKPVGNEKIKLTVVSGAVTFWEKPTKEVEVTTREFTPDNKAITLWVEATDVSKTIRDIEIKVEYNGASSVLKATAVWAKQTAVAYKTQTVAELEKDNPTWKDITDPPKDDLLVMGGTGLRPILAAIGVRNVILFQYSFLPSGVEKEPGVRFDLTRQAEGKIWGKTAGKYEEQKDLTKPPLKDQRVEKPNDDQFDTDESKDLDANGRFYGIDAHGPKSVDAFFDELVIRDNFREFMRVRFDGKRPSGNVESGSRCSDYYLWHSRHWLLDTNGKWTRSADPKQVNDIGPGHVTIGDAP